MKRYSRDPYWLNAKYAGKCSACGKDIRQGERVFYYPTSKRIYSGECAEGASGDFYCHAQDEAFFN